HAFSHRGITLAVNLLPAITRMFDRVRVVTTFHELFIPFQFRLKRAAGALWQRIAAGLLSLGSNDIMVTAEEWKRGLEDLGVEKPIELIPVGSNIPLVPLSDVDRKALRGRLLGATDGFLLGGFGARHDRDIVGVMVGLRTLKSTAHARLVWIGGSDK